MATMRILTSLALLSVHDRGCGDSAHVSIVRRISETLQCATLVGAIVAAYRPPHKAAPPMMTEPQLTRISKTLSYHLRHRPDALGLTLGPGGWVAVDDLLAALARHGRPATRAELDEVVARNPKQRFAFDETGTRIRASVDAVPPKFLQGETTSATAHLSIFDARADSDAELQRSDGGPNEH